MMPREKLCLQGIEDMTVQELLAVVLNTGYKGENVIELSARLIDEYGENALASITDPVKLMEECVLPQGKACQIIASFEIGRRFFRKPIGGAVELRRPSHVFHHLDFLHNATKEQFVGLYLSPRNKLIYQEVISIGSLDTSIIHPREVFAPAIQYRASRLIVAHNHPSQDPTPSAQDIKATKRLVKAGKLLGITLVDHVIITQTTYLSLSEEKLI